MPADDLADPLPEVCVGCGKPGTRSRSVRVDGPSSGYGLMAGSTPLDNLEKMARGPGSIQLPVCWWHRWIIPPSVSATAEDNGKVKLTGVSAEFAKALRGGPKPA